MGLDEYFAWKGQSVEGLKSNGSFNGYNHSSWDRSTSASVLTQEQKCAAHVQVGVSCCLRTIWHC